MWFTAETNELLEMQRQADRLTSDSLPLPQRLYEREVVRWRHNQIFSDR